MELEAASSRQEANPSQRVEQLRCRHDKNSQEDGGSCLLRSLQQHIEEGHPIGLFVITQAPPPDLLCTHYRHADGKRLPNPSGSDANFGHRQMKDCREDLCHGSDSDSTTWNSAAGCNSMRRIHATSDCTMKHQQQARNPSASLFLGQVGDLRSVTATAYELDKNKSSCRHGRNFEDARAEEEEGMHCDIDQEKMVEGDDSVVLSEEAAAAASKENPLYALRRNPKRSLRLVEEEYAAAARLDELTAAQALVDRAPKKVYTCSECLKEFPSGKALFGHMRCHPEREWRGIQPPAADYDSEFKGMSLLGQAGAGKKQCRASNADESESQSRMKVAAAAKDDSDSDSIEAAYVNHVVDQVDAHKSKNHNWMTGRRSRRSRQSHQQRSQQVEGEIKDEKDMANCLVMLACDTTRAGGLQLKRTPSCASANSHEDKNKFRMVDSEGDEVDWLESGKKASPGEESDHEDGAVAAAKYSCATCKRVFKSHQALGGHRASHKKVKGCFARTSSLGTGSSSSRAKAATATTTTTTITTLTTLEEGGEVVAAAAREASVTSSKGTTSSRSRSKAGHECSVCHRVFATGQALGGHKRCHWGGTGSSSDVTNLPRCSAADYKNPADAKVVLLRNKREELFLDLNLPPPQEDEDEQEEQRPAAAAAAVAAATDASQEQDNSMASCDTSTSSSSLREQQGKAWVAVAAADYSTPPTYYLPPNNNTNTSISSTRPKRIS